ncbi:MAG: PAS domain S-box protein [Desulfobacteraceae bacterium]|nr:PAS domain S-box protein [Desulfobacteraceae bacterium]
MNQPAADALGKNIGDLIGKNVFRLFPEDLAKKREQYHQQVFSSCQSVRYEDCRDGKWMDTTVDPVPDAGGNIICVAVFSRDMTDYKNLEAELREHQNHLETLVGKRTKKLSQANQQLEFEIEKHNQAKDALMKSETMLQAIFNQTYEYIGLLDLNGNVRKINTSALKLVDSQESDITGRPFWETPLWNNSLKEQKKIKAAVEKSSRGEFVRFETIYNRPGAKNIFIDFSIKPVIDANGKIINLIAEGHDITNLKAAMTDLEENESILKLQSKNLEDSNTALKVVLNQMEQKERQDKENFLLNIKQTVLPYLNKLKESGINQGQEVLIARLEMNLNKITSPLVSKLSSKYLNLTPMEIKVATLVKDGLVNKEIAELLSVSVNTITSHRYKIRTKLGLRKKSINLRSYLLSLER